MAGGGQPGNGNARKGKEWFDALRKECVQRKALEALATKVVDLALTGERWAIEEVANRFDGKVAQGVEVSGPAGEPIEVRDAASEELDARIAALTAQLTAWGA